MKTPKVLFVCRECGATSIRWIGKCPDCGAWDSYDEEQVQEEKTKTGARTSSKNKAIPFSELTQPEYLPSINNKHDSVKKTHHIWRK